MPTSVIAAVPPRLHPGVVRLHVRVGAEDRRHGAVEHLRQRDLLARRLGVEVDDDDLRLAPRLGDERLGDLERVRGRRQRQLAEQVDDGDRRAVGRRRDAEPPAGRLRGHVRRPDHALGLRQVAAEVALAPGPVPERDHVGARGEQPLGQPRASARARPPRSRR